MKAATYEDARDSSGGLLRPRPSDAPRRFWQLLRQDAARRSLRWSVPFALLIGLMIRLGAGEQLGSWKDLPIGRYHSEFVALYVYLWLAVLFAVIIAHFNSRCSSLSLGLPISPRWLWFARIVAVSSAGLIPIAIIVASTATANPSGTLGLDIPLLSVAARSGAGFVLAIVLFQLPFPGVYRISGSKRYVLYVALVSVATLLYSIFSPGSWIFTALLLVAAAVIGSMVGQKLPGGFRLAGNARGATAAGQLESGRKIETAAPVTVSTFSQSRRPVRRLRLLGVVLWSALNNWPTWLMIALIWVNVWALTAMYYKAHHPLNDFISLLLWCWIFMCQSVKRLGRIDHLPVSRTMVFSCFIVVAAIAVCGGLVTGVLEYRSKETPPTQVCFCDKRVRVPYEAWEVAWDGEAPEIESPWGETYTPYAAALTKFGKRAAVYNPFEHGKENSPKFVAWQIDRAVERVHGAAAVSPRVLDAAGDSAFVRAIESGEYTVETSLGKATDLRSRTNAVIIMIWFLMFTSVTTIWWMRYGPAADLRRTKWFAILFFGIPFAWTIVLALLSTRGIVNDWAILSFQMIVLRTIAMAVPFSTGVLWTLTAAVGIACLYVLQRRYARAESPTQQSGKHLLSEY